MYRTAKMVEAGIPAQRESAVTKLFVAESVWKIVDHAMQVLGGIGYTKSTLIVLTGNDVFGGYGLHLLFQVLESDPAPARERREQQQAIWTADDAGLVARERPRHRDVGDEEMPSVGGALERLAHRMARDAVCPARPDDDARTDRLRTAVRVDELDEDPVRLRLHLGRRDSALDHPAERREMGLEDPLGLVLRQAALELVAAVDAIVAHAAKLGHVRAVEAGTPDVLGGSEERR